MEKLYDRCVSKKARKTLEEAHTAGFVTASASQGETRDDQRQHSWLGLGHLTSRAQGACPSLKSRDPARRGKCRFIILNFR
jgi:hypothetical protein